MSGPADSIDGAGRAEATGEVGRTEAIDGVYRAEFGRALATLARMVGDIGLAEDAVHDAFADALRTWPRRGLPANPGAWITTAARNRAVDRMRRDTARSVKELDALRLDEVSAPTGAEGDGEMSPVADDQLRMIFTCCHPALSAESRVALTLRLVCGLRTAEIARAFLQPEQTVAQRLTRAKAKIRQAGIPLRVPPAHLLPERTPAVLACVYLVFSEGYFATSGPSAVRDELCDEAIRLGKLLCALLPEESEVTALLALMLLNDSRRGERRSAEGELVPLEEQDRSRWDRSRIEAGVRCLISASERAAASAGGRVVGDGAVGEGDPAPTAIANSPAALADGAAVQGGEGGAAVRGGVAVRGGGPYLAQARIAAAHAVAPSWARTDWRAIVAGYDELLRYSPSPVAQVNRAIAVGFRDGFDAGLRALDAVDGHPRLAGSHLVVATRADMLRRAGRRSEAAEYYRRAAESTANAQVRRFLARRIAEVTDG